MEVQMCDGGAVTISYSRPRRGMIAEGARSGTLLFEGVQQANGTISGRALLFSSRCGAIAYQVSGSNQGNSIVMTGSAPVRNKSCQVTRHRTDRLVFTLQGASSSPGGPQVVAPSCPVGFVLSGGQCVRSASPAPSCPAGFVFSGNQCVRAGVSAPAPAPAGDDWHAIGGSFKSRGDAQARANQLGGGWYIMNTSQCPNFRNGYWIATAGPTTKRQAQSFAASASQHGAYVKTCN